MDDWTLPESEIGKQTARAGIERAHSKENEMARKPRAVQQELIEDARQATKLPAKLRNKLAPLCAAEEEAGSARLRATELLAEIQAQMQELELSEVKLPNGGKVVYTEKKAARYVAPKKAQPVAEDDEDEEGEGLDDEE